MVVATHAEATKLTSATKIASKAILYYSDASWHHVYLLVREKMWWWLALAWKKMRWWIAAFGYSDHNDVCKYCLTTAILAAAAETIPSQRMQAAHRVARMSSATKISNAAIHFYCKYYAHLFVRESLLCDVLLHIGRLNSLFGNALQNATQIFFDRIPQITKYCIMRECENILRGYLYDGDLVVVILKGIYGFKFPQMFLEISSRDPACGVYFIIKANSGICYNKSMFVGDFERHIVTLVTAYGRTTTEKLVGTICLVLKVDKGKPWSYDIPDVVYDPESPYSLLGIPFLGKYFAGNDKANEFDDKHGFNPHQHHPFSNGTMANIKGILNMETFFARIINK